MSFLKRFPSYDHAISSAAASAQRFPLTLLSALVGTVTAVIMIGEGRLAESHTLEKLMMVGALGIAWSLAIVLWGERRRWSGAARLAGQGVGLILLVVYYYTLPDDPAYPEAHLIRFAILGAGCHFLVACLPFLGKGQAVGFWQYNKALLLRFLLAAFYSAVIFAGLAIALAAADHLFGADIDGNTYFQLWAVVVGLFNTWFFIAGIPDDLNTLGEDNHYPIGLKVFAQFVLLPLVGLYFAILIAYEFKIVIEWNWPKGWVSELILWYAVVGILSMLLLHPVRERTENKWINVFSTWFFRALIPLLVMLFLAIFRRVNDYGLTESRYLVLAMAVGLAVVMIYFIVSRTKDIRVIPAILAALAFLSAYGPWGAFAVSERNQLGRLETLLEVNELMADGKILPEVESGQPKDVGEMSNIVGYLCRRHGVGAFDAWLDDSAMAVLDTVPRYQRAEKVCEHLGFYYSPFTGYGNPPGYCHLAADDTPFVNISGYDYLINVSSVPGIETRQTVPLGNDTCECWFDPEISTFYVSLGRDSIVEVGTMPLGERVVGLAETQLGNRYAPAGYRDVPADSLTFDFDTRSYRARLMLQYLSGTLQNDTLSIDSFSGRLLIGWEP